MTKHGQSSVWRLVCTAFIDNYLVISYTAAIVVAMLAPAPGAALMRVTVLDGVHVIESLNIVAVFFCSGLTLKHVDARAALTEWRGTLWGLVAILGLTPLFGFATRLIPLDPAEYTTGLTVMCAVPTTLGTNLALARTARANVSLSTLLTVASNVVGVFTMPLWLRVLLPTSPGADGPAGIRSGGVNIPVLLAKLVVPVLLPTVMGAATRAAVPAVARAVDLHHGVVSLFSTTNLAMIVWQSLSVARPFLVSVHPISLLWLFLVSLAMQAVYYPLNGAAVLSMRLPAREATAVTITASQKSAPVAVAVVSGIAASTDALGLLVVPAVICQLTQVFSNQPLAYLFRLWTRCAGVPSVAPSVSRRAVAAERAATPDEEKGVGKAPVGVIVVTQ